MLIIHKLPPPTAGTGSIASNISSSTADASSINSNAAAENPRTVRSVPGNPTILDPFGDNSEIGLSPSPRGAILSIRSIPAAFLKNSADWRGDGLTTSTSDPFVVIARCTAFAATTLDYPHCREQFKIPRFRSLRNTCACFASH